jgi:hypothetical protein
MIQNIKIWNPNIDNKPFWVNIAHITDKNKYYINDEDIYFYVECDNVFEVGDLIMLDEQFAVLEVE